MQNADKEDAVVIAVAADGTTYLGATKIARAEITTQVRDMVASKLDKTVYVKSDARARYGDVVAVVDEVRAAGVDQLGLLTEKVEKARPAPPSGGSGQN
jgi:biopolymer transport protein ExbD/biopolymer transport protein TolR